MDNKSIPILFNARLKKSAKSRDCLAPKQLIMIIYGRAVRCRFFGLTIGTSPKPRAYFLISVWHPGSAAGLFLDSRPKQKAAWT